MLSMLRPWLSSSRWRQSRRNMEALRRSRRPRPTLFTSLCHSKAANISSRHTNSHKPLHSRILSDSNSNSNSKAWNSPSKVCNCLRSNNNKHLSHCFPTGLAATLSNPTHHSRRAIHSSNPLHPHRCRKCHRSTRLSTNHRIRLPHSPNISPCLLLAAPETLSLSRLEVRCSLPRVLTTRILSARYPLNSSNSNSRSTSNSSNNLRFNRNQPGIHS